jgi:hypothetical protein
MKVLSVVVLFLISCSAFAQEGWRDERGHSAPDTDARKSVSGFGGWVLVTSDADWQVKWEIPSNVTPHFTEARQVSRGSRVFVLTFFANPRLNTAGEANVTCDINVIRPDGTTSTHQTDAVCFKGELKTDPHYTYLAAPVIGFVGDPGDPTGVWLIQVNLKDNIRHVAVPLKTSFVLVDR